MNIYVDIDETICDYDMNSPREYKDAKPIWMNIDKINDLFDDGHKITYYTARGSIYKDRQPEFYSLTLKQLGTWGCKYHELIVGHKPAYDLMICDKTKRIEEI